MFKSKKSPPAADSKPDNFAMAYSISKKNRKKMAKGGEVKENPQAPSVNEAADEEQKSIQDSIESNMKSKQRTGKPGYAEGGMVDHLAHSIADAIIEKRHKMAQGGAVDLNANSEEEYRSPYDTLNADAADDEQYDLDQLSAQPEDSNQHGDELSDEDAHSMISKIRAKLRSKRG